MTTEKVSTFTVKYEFTAVGAISAKEALQAVDTFLRRYDHQTATDMVTLYRASGGETDVEVVTQNIETVLHIRYDREIPEPEVSPDQ